MNTMTNVDGLYAAKAVSIGDVVLTEAELPDCSLPRSSYLKGLLFMLPIYLI
jgi:hypothetical protein